MEEGAVAQTAPPILSHTVGVGLARLDGVDGHIEDVPDLVVGGGVGHFRSFPLLVDKIILPGNYLKARSYF